MNASRELPELFVKNHPREAAVALEKLPEKQAGDFIQSLDPDMAGHLLVYLTPEKARIIIEKIPAKVRPSLINTLPRHYAAIILRKLSRKNRNKIIEGLAEKNKTEIQLLLRYEEGTVGALMDPSVVVFVEDQTIGECLQLIKDRGKHPFFYYYVLHRGGQVSGIVNIYDMIKANDQDKISGLVHLLKYLISGHSEVPTIINNEELHQFGMLPVIDEQGLFNGIITLDMLKPHQKSDWESSFNTTGASLGEVFLLGLSGMLQGIERVKGNN